MTLSAVFRWKHPDSTLDMNRRLQTLIPRSVFYGGQITPGAGLTVNVSPFKGLSYDGMVVWDDATQTLGVVAGDTNYIVVRAKYVSGASPTVDWLVMDSATYAAHPDRDYLIVFGTVTLGGAAVSVALTDISYIPRDAVDPLQRHPFRGIATDYTTLPAEPPEQNHDGDIYFTLNAGGGNPGQTFYHWDDALGSWEIFNSGSYNVETSTMTDVLIDGERNRKEQGSGVIAGIRPATSYASDTEVGIIETPSVANQVGINTFSAIINGHYVQPYARNITLGAKPGAGTQYDLIFLEIWRESIAVPENHDFLRNPDGTTNYTISQVSDQLEQFQWETGTGGDNFDLNEIQADDHNWVVTKYRFGSISNVGAGSQVLYDNQVAAASATNVDGTPFAATPGPGTIDGRTWQATAAASSADGFSWAIPLFVVKRTSAEDHTVNDAIQIFRDDVRYIFPVYPTADVAQSARKSIDTQYRSQVSGYSQDDQYQLDYEKPSGFMTGFDKTIKGGVANNTIRFYDYDEGGVKIRMRGLDDRIDIGHTAGNNDFQLPTPPATGYERVLVYIKMSQTLYANAEDKAGDFVSLRHRPWFPDDNSTYLGYGWKRGFVTYEVEYSNLGAAATELDEHDAMTSAGWTKGDLSVTGNTRYMDAGIWSKTVAKDVDDRIHPYETQWAIPVCLVHRRNTGAWDPLSTPPNDNGSTGRPDGRTDANVIHQDDLVDLRRLVDVDASDLRSMLEQDVAKNMTGQLRTRMAEKWAGSGAGSDVAGTRILQSDDTDVTGGTKAFQMPANNASRKIWSDAREFVPVSESFDMGGDHNGEYADYNATSNTITVKAPTGSYLCRHLPAVYLTDGDSTNSTFLDYEAPPLLSTREEIDMDASPWPTPVKVKVIDTNDEEGDLSYSGSNYGWIITANDANGNATQMTAVDSGAYVASDTCVVSFWVHYDRSVVGDYAVNHGLAEIPDEVHSVVKDPRGTPTDVNVGTLYAIVRKNPSGGTSVIINNTDVAAVSGLSGTHTLVGIDWYNIHYSNATTPSPIPDSITMNNAQTQIEVNWTGGFTADVEFCVFFYTADVSEWVEIGRGGKSVRGLFSWEDAHTHDWGAGGPGSTYAYPLGTSTWQNAEVADRFVAMPQIWTNDTGLGADWTLWMGPISGATYDAGYEYSGMISITDPSATGMTDQYFKFVYPKWTPPSAASSDSLLINYTYTPYQGMSSTGGLKATPATALTTLKNMVHGTILENTDHIVTQSGACSVFGGVDGWAGYPTRRPNLYINFLGNRFDAYNKTQLVKETKASGLYDLGLSSDPKNLLAAAILRLPFPQDNDMQDGTSTYHDVTADWDIDPGREGVNSGFLSYAPGYPGALVMYGYGYLHHESVRSQYVNSLTRLAIPNEPKNQSKSYILSAAEYQNETGLTTNEVYSSVGSSWKINSGGDTATLDANLVNCTENCVVARTLTPLKGIRYDASDQDDLSGTGLRIIHPFVDYTNTGNLDNQSFTHELTVAGGAPTYFTLPNGLETSLTAADAAVYLGTAPGTILAYYVNAMRFIQPNLTIQWDADATVSQNRYITSSIITIESPSQAYNASPKVMDYNDGSPIGPGFQVGVHTDLITLPMGSSSVGSGVTSYTFPNYINSFSTYSSLKGKVIAYPSSWNATTISAVESMVQASEIYYTGTYGRGVFLGTTSARKSMPVLVPGSGTPLNLVIFASALTDTGAQPPDQYPIGPTVPMFAPSNRLWDTYDHGGPLAYSFYGLLINPSNDEYRGQISIQLSGGPTMGISGNAAQFNADILDGTALDAFWPSKRPLLPNGK